MATTLSGLSAATASTSTSSTASSGNGTLASNFATFLNLLTTQLKNQSPLDPLNTNEFTQQLVQFAGVEQQLKTNDSLTALLTSTKTANVTAAMGMVGARVTADGQTTQLKSGTAAWSLQAPRAVTGALITITDSYGSVVFTEKRNLTAGTQAYSWNGKTSTGALAPDGEYKVNVAALDPSGQTVTIRTELQGTVEKVDVSGTEPVISIGNIIIPLSKVKTIQRS